jgi:hypothetical protein
MKRLMISILVAVCLIASTTAFAEFWFNSKLVNGQKVFLPAVYAVWTSGAGIVHVGVSRVVIYNWSRRPIMVRDVLLVSPDNSESYCFVGDGGDCEVRPDLQIEPYSSVSLRAHPYVTDFEPFPLDGGRPWWHVRWDGMGRRVLPPLIESKRMSSSDGRLFDVDTTEGRVIREW